MLTLKYSTSQYQFSEFYSPWQDFYQLAQATRRRMQGISEICGHVGCQSDYNDHNDYFFVP
jgi:hypothetical protein